MPSKRVREVRALFDSVADLEPAARAAILATSDPALRREVEDLLAALGLGEQVFERPLPVPPELASQQLGRYRLVRLLGAGGMATVFEAVRDGDETRVALKLLRGGLLRETTLRRFRQEQWILGSLTHPHIATLLDTGVAPDERPYLVMEYLDGSPLTEWCAIHQLDVPARLALLRQACAAVHYAHGQDILHRDLKPANILVTAGQVKLLDFGIAKLLKEEPELEAIRTSLGSRALTPEYASPEQFAGDHLGPTTDVYSLGVVLFELLTGRLPHAVGSSLLAFTDEVRRQTAPRIRDVLEPNAPVPLDDPALVPLEVITARALAKTPDDRYPTAAALSDALAP